MASTVEIWNLAITDLGGSLVVDVLQNSTEADLCRLNYPYALDFVLESRDWNFATKRIEIAESSEVEPVFGYDSSFKIPGDALRVVEVWENKRSDTNSRFTTNNLQWAQEGEYISANTSDQIWVKYMEKVEDPNRFTSSFTSALSKYLAYRLAVPIASNRQLKADLLNEYELMLDLASVNDGVTGRTKILRSNVLMNARLK
jgi:hypothetical protein